MRLSEAINRLGGVRVGVIGDLVADLYVSGLTERVSREAPVLIVRHECDWLRPGGAANVAANLSALGGSVRLVGLVGDDETGRRLIGSLRQNGSCGTIHCDHVIETPGRSTISKTRFIAGAKLTMRQQVLRLDRQPPEPPDDGLIGRLAEGVARADPEVDAWVVSDYGYGAFNEPLRDLMRSIAGRKPVVADSRWDLVCFGGLTVLKPNEEEARSAAARLGFCPIDEGALAAELAGRLRVGAVVLTLGNKGMVVSRDGAVTRIPAVGSDQIVDLTGAGDSVAAALAAGLAAGCDILTAARLANHAGAVVVMKEGAATASPEELRASIVRAGEDAP